MLLDKNGILREDDWRHLADDEPAGASEAVTLSLARWEKERGEWAGRKTRLGLRLPNDLPPAKLDGAMHRFELIMLNFPRFTDGRAYSQARLLRRRLGYQGELRASGDVLRDQLLFMKRCGFDSFEVDGERAQRQDWAKAFGEFDLFYQPAEDHEPSIMRRRSGAA